MQIQSIEFKKKHTKRNKAKRREEVVHSLKSWEPRDKDAYAKASDERITAECCKSEWRATSNSENVDTLRKLYRTTTSAP